MTSIPSIIVSIQLASLFVISCNAAPPKREYVKLLLGGEGDPSVAVTKDGITCNTDVQDVPQQYGEPGRYLQPLTLLYLWFQVPHNIVETLVSPITK